MKVAAYQAPLLAAGATSEALDLIRTRVAQCEAEGVAILCCPEAILGGLADNAAESAGFALRSDTGQLAAVLAPLASETVTTVVGFTELTADGRLYNSAAVFHRGAVLGLYRKLHPAIRRSVYKEGQEFPIFRVGGLTFGIVICNDSNFSEPARRLAAQGATVLFVPTNNSLPPPRASAKLIAEARNADRARAMETGMWVIRADVAGRTNAVVSHGSSGFVRPDGAVVQSAAPMSETLLVAEIDVVPHPETRSEWTPPR